MKKYICMFLIMLILLPAGLASARMIDLDNYAFAHTNSLGIVMLTDKYGMVFNADAANGNGAFVSVYFRPFQGLGTDKLYIVYPDDTKQLVTEPQISLKKPAKTLRFMIEKTSPNETLIEIDHLTVDDPDYPDYLGYYYKPAPVTFGSLGKGSGATGGVIGGTPGGGNTGGGNTGGGVVQPKYLNGRLDDKGENLIWDTLQGTARLTVIVGNTVHEIPSGVNYFKILSGTNSYKVRAYDASGNLIGQSDVTATVNQVPQSPNPGSESGSGSGGSGGSSSGGTGCICADLCERLPNMLSGIRNDLDGISSALSPLDSDLQNIDHKLDAVRAGLDQIDHNTGPLHGDLQKINDSMSGLRFDLSQVGQLHDDLQKLETQLKPNGGRGMRDSVGLPDYYEPQGVGQKYEIKHDGVFGDAGTAPEPDAMPTAPEPKDWKYNGVELKPQEEIKTTPELRQTPELHLDKEMVSDPVMKQDVPLTQDASLQQDAPLTQDASLQQDAPLKQDAPLQQDAPLKQDAPLQQDAPLKQQIKDYPLIWEPR
ncbi:hypothetical protein [Paenibacillus polymyxa]|uniref:hypothetical protein n=1 Tax=Paenibacillus polymyxa TaxID=1406 RepID=UPI0021E3B5CC|nr:hypothetical protein [Paenibacillus polymyxa]